MPLAEFGDLIPKHVTEDIQPRNADVEHDQANGKGHLLRWAGQLG